MNSLDNAKICWYYKDTANKTGKQMHKMQMKAQKNAERKENKYGKVDGLKRESHDRHRRKPGDR